MPLLILVLVLFSSLFQTGVPLAESPLAASAPRVVEQEVIPLPYRPGTLAIDQVAEERMLELINAERRRAGLTEFALDPEITEIARAHAYDMWQRQYFAHENPDGETPLNRMEEGDVEFWFAGENLALTKTVERAHEGLMNSPGHKRNILDPEFTRIGIGVVDGGRYGKMFTQNFAD